MKSFFDIHRGHDIFLDFIGFRQALHSQGRQQRHRYANLFDSRQRIVDRIKLVRSVFAVDLCADAIMNNHYHIVVRID